MIASSTTTATDPTRTRLEALCAERDEVARQIDAAYLTCPVLQLVTLLERASFLDAQIRQLHWSAAYATVLERAAP